SDRVGSFYSQRMREVEQPGKSGNSRFVFPYQVMWERWQNSPETMLVGIGAGQSTLRDTLYEANFAPAAKVGVEFGVIGLAAFSLYWMAMYIIPAAPICITVALWAF